VLALDACYWKPVQSGLDGETDSEAVLRMTELPEDRIIPEAYRLTRPLSPDQAGRYDGVVIDPARLTLPPGPPSLIIEGAGGLMVPLNDDLLQVDLFARWGAPVVLAARSGLGTLNHTLLSIEALRSRAIPLAGVVLIGPEHRDNMASLERWTDAPVIGIIPHLDKLTRPALLEVYATRFLPIDAWSLVNDR
jgi:dethiobiotin synthetase